MDSDGGQVLDEELAQKPTSEELELLAKEADAEDKQNADVEAKRNMEETLVSITIGKS